MPYFYLKRKQKSHGKKVGQDRLRKSSGDRQFIDHIARASPGYYAHLDYDSKSHHSLKV